MTNEQCKQLSYYVTGTAKDDANVPTASGHAELFASLFSTFCTPHAQWTKGQKALREAFPQV
ncbi:hypothetical protein ABTE38_19855, partial [Acinetobacter baumannii]